MLHTGKIKFEPKQDFIQNKGKRKNPDNLQQTTLKKKQKIASDQSLFTNELAKYLEEQTDLEQLADSLEVQEVPSLPKIGGKTNTPIKDLIMADVFDTDDLENLNDDIWNAIKDRILHVKGVLKISRNELGPTYLHVCIRGSRPQPL